MASIALGLVGLLVAASMLWAATAGARGLGLGGERARGRRRGLAVAGLVLAAVGLLQVAGGLVELTR